MSYLVFDFETCYASNLPWKEGSYPVSLCLKYGDELHTWIFNHCEKSPLEQVDIKSIQVYFDKADLVVAHNLKFDLHWLRALGIDFSRNKLYCTMVAQYLIQNQNKDGISLSDCSHLHNLPDKIDKVKEWWSSGYETYDVPLSTLVPYGEQDVLNCEAIFLEQQKIIRKEGRAKIVWLRCESLRVTQEIEWNGMMLDTNFCEELSASYTTQMQEIELSIYAGVKSALPELAEVDFNLNSNDHLSAILFGGIIKVVGQVEGKREGTTKKGKIEIKTEGLGFTPAKGTETAKEGYYQTDVNQLDNLKAKKGLQQEFVAAIHALSKMNKMKGTYCDGLLDAAIKGYIHPTINECVTVTGRYSSQKPNTQNIPREGTSPVKQMFVSRYKEE